MMRALVSGLVLLAACGRDPVECIETTPAPLQVQAVIGERTETSFLLSWTCSGGMDVVDASLESPTDAFELTLDDPSGAAASQVRAAMIAYAPQDGVPDEGTLALTLAGEDEPVELAVAGLPVGLEMEDGIFPAVFEDCAGGTTVGLVNVGPEETGLGFGLGRSDSWSLGEPLPQSVPAGGRVEVPLVFAPLRGAVNEQVLVVAESSEGHRVWTRILGTVNRRYDLAEPFAPADVVGPLRYLPVEGSVSGVALPSGEALEVVLEPDRTVRVADWPDGAERLEIHYDRDVDCG